MARTRRQSKLVAGEMNLVAMIDVAFQLLSFFIITVSPVDIMTHLSVFRPMGLRPDAVVNPVVDPGIQVTVFADGYTVNDRNVSLAQMETVLAKLGCISPDQGVLIKCMNDAAHSRLVDLLDACARLRLTNLSVISSNV